MLAAAALTFCSSWASDAIKLVPDLRAELGLPSLRARQLHGTPSVLQVENLLTEDECCDIIESVERSGLLKASRVRRADGDGYEENAEVRDSQECVWAPDGCMALPDDALPVTVVRRLHRLLGRVADPDHCEGPKIVHYGLNQHYSEHCDCSAGLAATPAGQRTLTALLYLSTVPTDAGGCTHFPRLGLRVRPQRGRVLVWSNLDDDGECDRNTLHGSEPLLHDEEEKWVINFFYRQQSFFELALEREAARTAGTATSTPT